MDLYNQGDQDVYLTFKGIVWDRQWKSALYRDFADKFIYDNETKESFKFQSDPSSKVLHNRRLKNKMMNS